MMSMKYLPAAIVLLVTAAAFAQPPAKRPTQAVAPDSCVTAECHAEVKNFPVVHGPVNVNACDACHTPAEPARHTFKLAREKTETCTFCHQMELDTAPVVHKPLQTGDCLPCHNPHGGKTGKFLRGESMNDLCKQCHQDQLAGKKYVHGPAAAGACEACHQPHTSQLPNLLVAEKSELCLSCHREMGEQLSHAKFTHKAVTDGQCTDCHDSHASDFPMQTLAAGEKLCTSCHEPIRKSALDAKYKHTVVTSGQACLNCHTAHGGQLGKLMKSEPITVCMNCHNKKIVVDKTRSVNAVSEVLDPRQIKHGPIQDSNCSGCHNVHGSDVAKLLTKPYPGEFYASFDLSRYELCFSCHDKQLVLADRTRGLTGFRNGEQNLHYVHVNKTERGRTCRACHAPHASSNDLHLRDTVPFGKWQMPINFKRNQTGGSCAPGCHKPYIYDREKPQSYKEQSS